MRSNVLVIVALSLGTLTSAACGAPVSVWVWNGERSSEYELMAETATIRLKQNPPETARLMRKDERNNWREGAAGQLSPTVREQYRWAEMSPDCNLAIVGKQSLIITVHELALMDRQTGNVLVTQVFKHRRYVVDVGWSDDSRFAVVLEAEGRFSGGVGALGHPRPLVSFTAIVFDMHNMKSSRVTVAKDVPLGEAGINSPPVRCSVL